MERDLEIATPDGKRIYGRLRGELGDTLAVFVHGLTGEMDEHQFYNGARYLGEQGYPTYRFNLYDWREGARRLSDCTLGTHGGDLDTVIRHFRAQGVRKIALVGHSYGAPTILMADEPVEAITFWDPAYGPGAFDGAKYVPALEAYVMGWGTEIVVGKAMVEEREVIDWEHLASELETPLQVISAGAGVLIEAGQRYVDQARGETKRSVIEGAGHSFGEDGVAEQLFGQTADWILTYL